MHAELKLTLICIRIDLQVFLQFGSGGFDIKRLSVTQTLRRTVL